MSDKRLAFALVQRIDKGEVRYSVELWSIGSRGNPIKIATLFAKDEAELESVTSLAQEVVHADTSH